MTTVVALLRPASPAAVTITDPPRTEHVSETGAVSSVQRAELEMPVETLEELWKPATLERLARAYWRYLNRVSLGLLRVVYSPTGRTVVLLVRPFSLLRFKAPEYEVMSRHGSVTWQVDRGLLVARQGRGQGFLRISIDRRPDPGPERGCIAVSAEVRNFYPWLRGSGRFARFGTWLYSHTQVHVHVLVTHGFLRSLARLELPPTRVGVLPGEIAAGALPDAEEDPHDLPSGRVDE
jgi:hypothetical protein